MAKRKILRNEDLCAKTPYATIHELSDVREEDIVNLTKYSDCIRVYCSQSPDVFTFQIRTHKPITEFFRKSDEKRFMLASVNLSIAELEQILEYAKAQYPDMKRVNTGELDLIPSDESQK